MNRNKLSRKVWLILSCCLYIHIHAFDNSASESIFPNQRIWYKKPASGWSEALPLGNGRIGAMVFGRPNDECITFNEATFWSGSPHSNHNPNGKEALHEIRNLLFEKKFQEAKDLTDEKMLSKNGHGMMFVPVGNLRIFSDNIYTDDSYSQQLDLTTGIYKVQWEQKGITYTRECFVSYTDDVFVLRMSCNGQKCLNASISLDSPMQSLVSICDSSTMLLEETSPDHEGVKGKVNLNAYATVEVEDGILLNVGNSMKVKRAHAFNLYISMRTNYKSYDILSLDPTIAYQEVNEAKTIGYEELKKRHVEAFTSMAMRSLMDMESTPGTNDLPTNERLINYKYDKSLPALFYNFNRYLFISGSRPGGQPTNLQGLWNGDIRPEWDSKYTININTEMNYWAADATNLMELHEPLFSLLHDLSKTGQITAKEMYGARGWTAHHNTDLWRTTGMVDGATWGAWPFGGIWLSQHIWTHYLYTGDKDFLNTNYPILKGCSEFLLDFLKKEPDHDYLVGGPSISPENSPKLAPGNARVNYGCSIDNELSHDIFFATCQAANILGIDDELCKEIKKADKKLAPLQIGQFGQLQEWLWDWDIDHEQQSHMSHLYCLYPSSSLSYYETPELNMAAINSLMQRYEDGNTSWSNAWRTSLWSRLHNGEKANEFLHRLMQPATNDNGYAGSFPNMLSCIQCINGASIFQIDANYGTLAAIAEMLIQSHDGAIDILPALPTSWSDGEIKGLRTRGGFIVDLAWKDGKLSRMDLTSTLGGSCTLRYNQQLKPIDGIKIKKTKNTNPLFVTSPRPKYIDNSHGKLLPSMPSDSYTLSFATEKGHTYTFQI